MRLPPALPLVPLAFAIGCHTPFNPPPPKPSQSVSDVRIDYGDPVLNSRKILLIGDINDRVAEIAIQKFLYLDAKSQEPIDLYLQTPGGLFKPAMAIEQTIRLLKSPVNTYALSECNSGGAVLLAAGTGKRRAFRKSIIVVHGIKVTGKPPADFTEKIQDTNTDFWRRKARLPEEWLPIPSGTEHVLTAEQALEYGIVDEVIDR